MENIHQTIRDIFTTHHEYSLLYNHQFGIKIQFKLRGIYSDNNHSNTSRIVRLLYIHAASSPEIRSNSNIRTMGTSKLLSYLKGNCKALVSHINYIEFRFIFSKQPFIISTVVEFGVNVMEIFFVPAVFFYRHLFVNISVTFL